MADERQYATLLGSAASYGKCTKTRTFENHAAHLPGTGRLIAAHPG